jgi:hypothetical protein
MVVVALFVLFGGLDLDPDLSVVRLDLEDRGPHGAVGHGEVDLDAVVDRDRVTSGDTVDRGHHDLLDRAGGGIDGDHDVAQTGEGHREVLRGHDWCGCGRVGRGGRRFGRPGHARTSEGEGRGERGGSGSANVHVGPLGSSGVAGAMPLCDR